MARGRNNYFKMFVDLLGYSKRSILFMAELMQDFDPDDAVLSGKMGQLHAIEHAADEAKHSLMEKLVREFVTPIEREDIMEIAASIDNVTDCVEDILQRIYMHHIKEIRPEGIEFIKIIDECIDMLINIYTEFEHYKKSNTIHRDVVELNRLEEVADGLYITATRNLYDTMGDPMDIRKWSIVFERMEICCDACETTANLVEEVIMKNS